MLEGAAAPQPVGEPSPANEPPRAGDQAPGHVQDKQGHRLPRRRPPWRPLCVRVEPEAPEDFPNGSSAFNQDQDAQGVGNPGFQNTTEAFTGNQDAAADPPRAAEPKPFQKANPPPLVEVPVAQQQVPQAKTGPPPAKGKFPPPPGVAKGRAAKSQAPPPKT